MFKTDKCFENCPKCAKKPINVSEAPDTRNATLN